MSSVIVGVGAACGASALYNAGVALQAVEARRAPIADGMRLGLLTRLARRPWWLAGIALGLIGWPLQVAALLAAPLTVVQPALGVGLIMLLPIGAMMLGERVTRIDAGAVVALLACVALLAAVAPSRETAVAGTAKTAIVLAVIAVLALAPYARARVGAVGGWLAAWAAGAGFAWSGLSSKLLADAVAAHHWVVALAWALATGLASGLAVLSESTALQHLPVHRTAPTIFAAQVLIPVAAAPLLVGEAWSGSALRSLALLAGLAGVLAAAAMIARSQAAIALTAIDRPLAVET